MLDLHLPLLDGFGVAQGLRAIYDEDIPIVVLTAGGRIREHAEAMLAYDYLPKPFELDDLLCAVHRGLDGKEPLRLTRRRPSRGSRAPRYRAETGCDCHSAAAS